MTGKEGGGGVPSSGKTCFLSARLEGEPVGGKSFGYQIFFFSFFFSELPLFP